MIFYNYWLTLWVNNQSDSYRFKPRLYGYGLKPISWQGWLTLVILIIVMFAAAYRNGLLQDVVEPTSLQIVGFLFDELVITLASMSFLKDKTNGPMFRRRGKDK